MTLTVIPCDELQFLLLKRQKKSFDKKNFNMTWTITLIVTNDLTDKSIRNSTANSMNQTYFDWPR